MTDRLIEIGGIMYGHGELLQSPHGTEPYPFKDICYRDITPEMIAATGDQWLVVRSGVTRYCVIGNFGGDGTPSPSTREGVKYEIYCSDVRGARWIALVMRAGYTCFIRRS